jgi:hypothetical protein
MEDLLKFLNVKNLRYALPTVIALVACDSGADINTGGAARVFLAGSLTASSAQIASNSDEVLTEAGPVGLAMVDSINVVITAVQALVVGGDSVSGFRTIKLSGEGGKRINLLALPSEAQDSITIARGDLPAGTYDHIRLQVADSGATITLKEDVSMGGSIRLTKGTHPLTLPSALQSGLKIKTARFTVSQDSAATIKLVFDGASSVGNVQITGNGVAQMSPVLRARN